MRWLWRRRELGSVDAILVRVWPAGSVVERRLVGAGRVLVSFEDGTGRVLVEADTESMAGMLARALREVEDLVVRQRELRDRALLRAARARGLLEEGGGDAQG